MEQREVAKLSRMKCAMGMVGYLIESALICGVSGFCAAK
jgi:hypothetical protein